MQEVQNNTTGQRLDVYLVHAGFFRSRDRAKEAILAGHVKVDGKVQRKVAAKVSVSSKIDLTVEDYPYVGRAALKLEAALDQFEVKVRDKIALDIGVATGGFSDLLLRMGAEKVYGIDIGEGQIEPSLLSDPRFIYRNHTDARDLQSEDFVEKFDLIVVNVAFISICALLPALTKLVSEDTSLIVLVKPQYELGIDAGRLLKNKKLVQEGLKKIKQEFTLSHLNVVQEMDSPVSGKEGTQEYLWLIKAGLIKAEEQMS